MSYSPLAVLLAIVFSAVLAIGIAFVLHALFKVDPGFLCWVAVVMSFLALVAAHVGDVEE